VLGGTQSLHTNARDEALGLPTEDSAQLALRTQQIIAYETGVTNTADPLGGSYYIEDLTDRIERAAVDYIRRIDEMGGTLQAIEAGFIQNEIQRAAYDFQKSVESGERVIVGVNGFQMEEHEKAPVFRIDPDAEKAQVERIRQMRAARDNATLERRLEELEAAARGTVNLMPCILAAAEASGTVGEISDTLRGVFGEYRDAA
jgi:methylmalonyl-CoA mutase N-terminal domain/subunit